MSRFVVVERDAARRDSLRFVLNQAGYEVTLIESLRAAASQLENADLLIIGDADLPLLNQLSQADPPSLIPVLALINPGNFVGILQCLRGGVAKIVSRQRPSNEILEQIRLLLGSFRSDSTARTKPAHLGGSQNDKTNDQKMTKSKWALSTQQPK